MSSKNEYKTNKVGRVIGKIITYLLLIVFALFMLLPFYYMIITSFVKTTDYEAAARAGEILLFPNFNMLTIDHYKTVFGLVGYAADHKPANAPIVGFGLYFINTLIVAVVSTTITLFTTLLASFAFARLEFKGKNALFSLILATMMVPGEMMILTNFQTQASFGWMNSFSSLILVHGVAVFYIFQLRQTFQQIPNELYLASKVDGYTDMQYFRKIMVPLASSTVTMIAILSLMGAWNSYIWPTLVATGPNVLLNQFGINWNMRLVSNGLMSMFSSEFADNVPGRLAGSMVVTIPLIIVFAIFRKKIMTGVSRSGIKG